MLAHRLKKSKPAIVLLTISGVGLFVLSVAILLAGCFLIYHENFQDSSGLKQKIQVQFDYSHYWLGGTYLIIAILTLSSACRQNKRRLPPGKALKRPQINTGTTFTTATFLTLALALSLFAIVLDGPDWVEWKNIDRTMKYWGNKDSYSCSSKNKTCICKKDSSLTEYVEISTIADCDDVVYLTTIYGTIIGGAVIGFSVCLAALLVMVNSVSWKNPWKAFASYTASYENKVAIPAVTDALQMYRDQPTRQPTLVSSSTSSLARHNKEYMPAWSLYGSTAEDINDPDPYTNQN